MSRFNLRLRVIALAVTCVAFSTISANAQTWTKIGTIYTIGNGEPLYCTFFWDTAHGVVGGKNAIYTYKSGVWTQSTYPEGFGTFGIAAIRQLKPGILYAAQGATQVWVSADSGASWQLSGITAQNTSDVYLAKDGSVKAVLGTFANLDSDICVSMGNWWSGSDGDASLYSNDGGVTWDTSKWDNFDLIGSGGLDAYADSCHKVFFAIGGSPVPGAPWSLYSSVDSGRNWFPVSTPMAAAVEVDGIDGITFAAGDSVYRSADAGCSWQFIGAPWGFGIGASQYGRICTFVQNGVNLVVVIDGGGSTTNEIWLCTHADSGMSPNSPIEVHDTTIECSAAKIPIRVRSNECSRMSFQIQVATDSGNSASAIDTLIVCPPGDTITFYLDLPAANSTNTQNDANWKILTTGGDGCKTYSWTNLFHVARTPGQPKIQTVTNLAVKECSSIRLPVIFKTSPCEPIRIDSIGCDSTYFLASFNTAFPDTILAGMTDTVWMLLNAIIPGTHNFEVRCHILRLGQQLPVDTTMTVSIDVPTNPLATIFSAPVKLSVSNCGNSTVPIYFHAQCDSIEFSSCTLTIDKSLSYSTNLIFPLTLPSSSSDTLLITFPPQNLNSAYIIYAEVKGTYLGSNVTLDTTIQIRVNFTSLSGALIASTDAIALDTVSACGATDSLATFTNLGCDTINVTNDQTIWKAGWSASDPAFPFSLAPDSSFTVLIHFVPNGPATSNQNLIYAFESQGGQTGTSSQLLMTAVAIPAMASLSISDAVLNFGTFPRCSASADTSITITNTGCDSLSLSGTSVDPGSGFTLINRTDTTLGTNGSARYTIHFADSVIGALNSTLHIHGVGANGGNAIDTSVPLNATIVSGDRSLAASISAANLGSLYICQSKDTSITLYNKGCDTLKVDNSEISNSSYTSPASFPIIILPGDSSVVPISLKPSDSILNCAITFSSNANTGDSVATVQLQAILLHPASLKIVLGPSDSSIAGDTITGYVILDGAVPAGLISALDFDITHNDDLLSFVSAGGAGLSLNKTLPATGIITQSFTLAPVVGRTSSSDTIGVLRFKVYLSDSSSTQLSLSNISFTTSSADFPPDCIASIGDTGASFTYLYRCGNEIIQDAMLGKLPFSIESIQPNPAQNQITVRYRVSGLENSDLKFELENILGETVLTQHSASASAETQDLDVSSFPSGIYFIRLSANGYVQSREIVIER